jgi:hypothetical protein
MILIAHRGNTNGPMVSWENEPTYIDLAISKGFDVEIDVWLIDGLLYLGHDEPQYGVNFRWFGDRISRLWVHCKNIEAAIYFSECEFDINYFWHENDTITLTSKKYIWAYPGKQPIRNSIAVMPEINQESVDKCSGVCSDFIEKYKI